MARRKVLKLEGFNPVREPYGITLLSSRPKFIPKIPESQQSASMRKGMRYERMIKSIFSRAFRESYCHGQWIEFQERGIKRWCQVDGIWVDRERKLLTIFEIKYRHTMKAWWQLRRLYSPILWRYLRELGEREFKIAICEVVKVFDPSVEFPEEVSLISNVEEIRPGRFQVIQIEEPDFEIYAEATTEPQVKLPNSTSSIPNFSLLGMENL